jgi:hypothetical protein
MTRKITPRNMCARQKSVESEKSAICRDRMARQGQAKRARLTIPIFVAILAILARIGHAFELRQRLVNLLQVHVMEDKTGREEEAVQDVGEVETGEEEPIPLRDKLARAPRDKLFERDRLARNLLEEPRDLAHQRRDRFRLDVLLVEHDGFAVRVDGLRASRKN